MPSNCSTEYNTLDLWVYVAKMTEKAKMDGVFSADMLRLYKTQGNDWSDIARLTVQFTVSDPMMVLFIMAYATKNIGLIRTRSILQTHPLDFPALPQQWTIFVRAGLAGTLSVVLRRTVPAAWVCLAFKDHATPYAWAGEFVDVAYKLWGASWGDGATTFLVWPHRAKDLNRR